MNELAQKIYLLIDAVTDNRTELFIFDKTKTLEEIKKLVQEQWTNFIKLQNNYERSPYQFEDIDNIDNVFDFLEVTQITEKDINNISKRKRDLWAIRYRREIEVGDVYVTEVDENSIPFDFFCIIKKTFDIKRYYLV
jgi:hypothetical protein